MVQLKLLERSCAMAQRYSLSPSESLTYPVFVFYKLVTEMLGAIEGPFHIYGLLC